MQPYTVSSFDFWWVVLDSNQGIPKEADLQSAAIATKRTTHIKSLDYAASETAYHRLKGVIEAPAAFLCASWHYRSKTWKMRK